MTWCHSDGLMKWDDDDDDDDDRVTWWQWWWQWWWSDMGNLIRRQQSRSRRDDTDHDERRLSRRLVRYRQYTHILGGQHSQHSSENSTIFWHLPSKVIRENLCTNHIFVSRDSSLSSANLIIRLIDWLIDCYQCCEIMLFQQRLRISRGDIIN